MEERKGHVFATTNTSETEKKNREWKNSEKTGEEPIKKTRTKGKKKKKKKRKKKKKKK